MTLTLGSEDDGGGGGTKFNLQNPTFFLGRSNSNDQKVSRRHVSFHFQSSSTSSSSSSPHRISFEVIGRNPIWVRYRENEKVRTYKRSEKGEVGVGDMVCVSGRNPVWYTVKESVEGIEKGNVVGLRGRLEEEEEEDGRIGELGFWDVVDLSNIDPVQEFGFLVIGHEFDNYPKQMIRNLKNFNWFLDDPGEDAGDEDESENEKKRSKRKRRKAKGKDDDVDDENWISGSGDDELIGSAKNVQTQRPKKYHTRSKDHDRTRKGTGNRKGSSSNRNTRVSSQEEDEVDETLGGFIVDTVEVEEAEEIGDEEDEEEEFDDDEGDEDE